MSKRIVLVGHCGPDSSYLRLTVGKAVKGSTVLMADDDAHLRKIIADGADLLLLNRVLDYGFTKDTGVDLITELRQSHPDLKTMLVSNYEDAQAAAVKAGALPGFGKRELGSSKVTELLASALSA